MPRLVLQRIGIDGDSKKLHQIMPFVPTPILKANH